MSGIEKSSISRRGFFRAAGVATLAAGGAMLATVPRVAEASDVENLITEQFGAGEMTEGKITISPPSKAENAALVRMPVSVDHPMDADNYIQTVGIFVDNNPAPFVGKFDFTPAAGKAQFEVRIKMAKSSKVRVVAKTNKGKLLKVVQEVEVTAGGCLG